MKLKPAPNQKPAGYWHRQCYHADIDLWDVREAIPIRYLSVVQSDRVDVGVSQSVAVAKPVDKLRSPKLLEREHP